MADPRNCSRAAFSADPIHSGPKWVTDRAGCGRPEPTRRKTLNRTKSAIGARFTRTVRGALLLALTVPLILGLFAGSAGAKFGPGHQVNVMTRNLYLGADLSAAIAAKSTKEFVEANGKILRDVTANDFPVRAKGLAKEINKKKP